MPKYRTDFVVVENTTSRQTKRWVRDSDGSVGEANPRARVHTTPARDGEKGVTRVLLRGRETVSSGWDVFRRGRALAVDVPSLQRAMKVVERKGGDLAIVRRSTGDEYVSTKGPFRE